MLVVCAVCLFAVDMFQRADWLISIRKSPAFQAVLTWVLSPLGFVLIFIVGVLWLTVLGLSSADSDDLETIAKRAPGERTPEPSKPAPVPANAIAETALDAAPNIIVVETSLRRLTQSPGGIDENPTGDTMAAVVCFRNDAIRARQVGEMTGTKAHLRFEAASVPVLNIDAGCWLGQEYNTADFSPGDTRTLVIGVQTRIVEPPEIRIAVPDDRRVDSDTWLDIRWKNIKGDSVVVHVKLVGGWPKIHVFEFDFFLSAKPFKIENLADVPETV
ncbi:MAG TPA: hypothetical protein VGA84_00040 [Thermoanaerobaculia bacterium]